jgi:transcriptional/translational regulatory protein YebC/TACO1
MQVYEDSFEILTAMEDFTEVSAALKEAGYEFVEADIQYIPSMEATPKTDDDIKNLKKMIDVLEDNDDVQGVHHNCAIDLD